MSVVAVGLRRGTLALSRVDVVSWVRAAGYMDERVRTPWRTMSVFKDSSKKDIEK